MSDQIFRKKSLDRISSSFFEINQEDDEKSDFLPAGLRPAPGCGVGRPDRPYG